ncbi:MAG TPA: hypothetical protein VE046_00185 [Steroidobacteraceae bacterium]|nr:hypothetical protein [Steroidobacteraceae bacterium]
MTTRTVRHLIKSTATSDGAGAKLRSLGQSPQAPLDPFLMFDEFSWDDAADGREDIEQVIRDRQNGTLTAA